MHVDSESSVKPIAAFITKLMFNSLFFDIDFSFLADGVQLPIVVTP